MSDLEVLVAVLGLFYLYECTFWVRPGCSLLVAQLPGRSAHLRRTALLQNDLGAILFGNLLPVGHTALVQLWPFSVSDRAVYAYTAAALPPDDRADRGGRIVPFEKIHSVTSDGKRVLINEASFVEAGSVSLARHFAGLLTRLAAVPEGARGAAINDALKQSLDVDRAEIRFQEYRRHARPLLVPCMMFFGYLFLVLPGLVQLGVPVPIWIAAPVCLPLMLWIVLEYWRAYRALHPEERSGWWRHLSLMLLSPAYAIHARDTLLADALTAYHPLAAAAVLCPRPMFEEMAGLVLCDHRHPLPPSCPPDAPELARSTEEWFREPLGKAIDSLLRRAGLDPARLLAAPAPEDERCRSYCPRCRGQHELPEGRCSSCGCALLALAPRPTPAPAERSPASGAGDTEPGNPLTRAGA